MRAQNGIRRLLRRAWRLGHGQRNFRALAARPEIENLRGYPVERVAQLRKVLVELAYGGGVTVQPDLRRPGFYDLLTPEAGFYVHLSPVSGKWYLLGVWARQTAIPDEVLTRAFAATKRMAARGATV